LYGARNVDQSGSSPRNAVVMWRWAIRHSPPSSRTYVSWTSDTDTGRVRARGASPSRAHRVRIDTPEARVGDSTVRRRLLWT
jgi:hypothetical protein